LDALGCRSGKRDFQKKLFLYTREVETEPSYEFVPYQFGAFSFTSNVDMRKLSDRGFLNEQGNFWILTPNGQREVRLPLEARERMLGFAQHIAVIPILRFTAGLQSRSFVTTRPHLSRSIGRNLGGGIRDFAPLGTRGAVWKTT
jgi:hypothetical protein